MDRPPSETCIFFRVSASATQDSRPFPHNTLIMRAAVAEVVECRASPLEANVRLPPHFSILQFTSGDWRSKQARGNNCHCRLLFVVISQETAEFSWGSHWFQVTEKGRNRAIPTFRKPARAVVPKK